MTACVQGFQRFRTAKKYNGVVRMQDNRALQQNYEPELIDTRRNPYLLDYEEQRRGAVQRQRTGQRVRRESTEQMYRNGTDGGRTSRTAYNQDMRQPVRRSEESRTAYRQDMRQPVRRAENRTAYRQDTRQGAVRQRTQGGQQSREAMLRERRRRQVRRQKIAVGIWAVCIIAISGVLFFNHKNASATEPADTSKNVWQQQHHEEPSSNVSGATIQGLPVEKFTAHPEWTESFLTPNEYSRPGEPLLEVKDVFVHYTANPGTSAAQNRSYFEQQKDTHMASVSSHFIIGYEGEIIQCVPLDEIAYAVVSRNYDSVSIECCYTAKDGSFTKETYDSLISLLAWLTDAYDLDTSHILRHYDCGGKKCPIYYTENEDKWEQLKKDVKAYK